MNPDIHERAFLSIKRTIMDWAIKSLDVDEAQRTVGHLASRGIAELLTAHLHRTGKLPPGGFINHRWFRSRNLASAHLPAFPHREDLISDLVSLELECDKLAYGRPVTAEKLQQVVRIFIELEKRLEELGRK